MPNIAALLVFEYNVVLFNAILVLMFKDNPLSLHGLKQMETQFNNSGEYSHAYGTNGGKVNNHYLI
jgi:hypothetical protein